MPIILQPLLDFAGRLLDVASRLVPLFGAFLAGRWQVQKADAECTAKAEQRQLEIAARAPAGRDALLERMRGGQL